jgi:hypothetical protein
MKLNGDKAHADYITGATFVVVDDGGLPGNCSEQ